MYKYRLLGVQKMGNKNIYSVNFLGTNNIKMVGLHDIKQALIDNEFTNAVLKGGKVVEVYDVQDALKELYAALEGQNTVQVKVVRTSSDKSHRYTKFYNMNGRDITKVFWFILQRYYSLTQKDELSISGGGMDMIYHTLKMVNGEAHLLGMGDVVSEEYSLYKGK